MKKIYLVLTLCLFAPLTFADLTIENAWIKNAPPVAPARAAYLTLRNDSNKPITISKLSSKQFKMVEMHETLSNNGVYTMQKLSNITIPAHSVIEFKPMGKHIMLMMPNVSLHGLKQIELKIYDTQNNMTQIIAPVKDSL